ncbi:MAG: MBL fold metallo-hydrolase [Planctomycetota bacterium]|nr:MBL fold metallo-hydrolase [Planctomycetota bacterium]
MCDDLRSRALSPGWRRPRSALRRVHFGSALLGPLVLTGLLLAFATPARPQDSHEPAAAQESQPSTPGDEIVLRIVYDNNPHQEGLKTAWGFGCVITGCEKTILFDTGGEGDILLRNMNKCGIDPREIDAVVLSHIHGDHTGGLDAFLAVNPKVDVYLPKVFPDRFKAEVRRVAEHVIETEGPREICPGVHTTGVLMEPIPEQGLSLDTPEGLLVITGCAHPGIVPLAQAAHEQRKKPVRLVLGGFHLVRATPDQLRQVITGLERLDAQQVAPCHCSGDNARTAMKRAFDERCVEVGVGSRLGFPRAEKTSN